MPKWSQQKHDIFTKAVFKSDVPEEPAGAVAKGVNSVWHAVRTRHISFSTQVFLIVSMSDRGINTEERI